MLCFIAESVSPSKLKNVCSFVLQAQENSLPAGGEAGKGIGILGNLSGASSSRTSLQTSSIEVGV